MVTQAVDWGLEVGVLAGRGSMGGTVQNKWPCLQLWGTLDRMSSFSGSPWESWRHRHIWVAGRGRSRLVLRFEVSTVSCLPLG